MNIEENRLRTFTEWPSNAAVDAGRVAKAGFYYTGMALEVQCFLCGEKVTEWNYGDQAMARHRQVAPNCPFVLSPSNTCNVPLVPAPTPNTGLSRARSNEDRNVAESAVVQNPESETKYNTFCQRLRSFNTWPLSNTVSPQILAKSGFYYLQQSDMVKCAFCKGVLMKWEPGDNPDTEHRIHFPNCDFYMRQSAEDDIIELSNVRLICKAVTDLKELGIQTHTAPQKPQYIAKEVRLQTFQGWPKDKLTPEMLATAGFYYVGTADNVRCFHCDGGLHNWEATDDAWTEHAKWFPKCGFVNLVRGSEFIKECIKNRPPLDPSIFENIPQDNTENEPETPDSSLSTVTPPTQEVTEAVIEGLLSTVPAMVALEVGLQVGRVKRVLKKRMEEFGVPYENSDRLIEDVLQDQIEDDNRLDVQNHESSPSELIPLLNQITTTQVLNDITRQVENSENSSELIEINTENKVEEIDSSTTDENKPSEVQTVDITSEMMRFKTALLQEENRKLREAQLCKICMDKDIGVVFLPCGHLTTCSQCAPSLNCCPICRQEIRATVRTFLS